MRKTLHTLFILLLLFGVSSTAYAQDPGQDPDPAAETPKQPRVMILGNVYGGGELAQVIAESKEVAAEQLIQDADLADLFTTHTDHVYTTYVHLGINSEVYGRVFGGGRGQHDGAILSSGRVTGQTDVALDGATVWSEIYGGGEMADVRGNTLLHFKKGKAGHNAFGGGLGKLGKRESSAPGAALIELGPEDNLPDNRYEPLASADVMMIPSLYDEIIKGERKGNLTTSTLQGYYRDGQPITDQGYWMTEKKTGESFVVFDGKEETDGTAIYTHYEFEKARTVNRDAYGNPTKGVGGKYYTETDQFNASRPEQLFSINHNIYGGGMTASKIDNKTFVHINYGMVNQEMMDYKHENQKVWSTVYNSIANAQFCVFGGGYGYYTDILGDTNVTMDVQGSGHYKYINEFTKWFANEGKDKYGWDTNTGAPEKIYAAADEATHSHGAPGRSCMDIVGGGYNGKVYGTTHVTVSGDVVLRKVYGGGYYSSVGNTDVQIMSGIYNRVYGGGLIGNVYGTANLTFGQQGGVEVHDANLHLMVKDAIYGGNDVSGTVGTTPSTGGIGTPGLLTNYGVTYNVYDPVDADGKGVRLNIFGGLVLGDVYGAGNGNHPGYTNPEFMDFVLSQHPGENYRRVRKADIDDFTDLSTPGDYAYVYKYRPRTARVEMNIVGNAGTDFNDDPQVDKVRIWGRTFGGGNSCNVGVWDGSADDNAEVYADDASSWHPGDNFQGNGTIQINIGNHVQLGNRNDSHETPNGLFMGSNGEHMVTQTIYPSQLENYHHFYHPSLKKYLPGFLVYDASGNDIGRKAGLKAFAGFINNILTWTDNVSLNIANDAQDVWMSNFVGGGYRGSMKAKSATGKFAYTLPTGVTIGHSVVGGAFNAHIVYRIYKSDSQGYAKDSEGNYTFQTDIPGEWVEDNGSNNGQYLKALYEDPEHPEQITGILRYNFDGGIMGHESSSIAVANGARCGQVRNTAFDFTSPTKYNKDNALVYLNLRNKLDPIVTEAHDEEPAKVHGGIVYGGCFHSGYIDGDVWVDYRCSLSPSCKGLDPRFFDKTNSELYTQVDELETHNALNVFGAGYGTDTHTMGDTYVRILHNGSSDDAYDYPFVYNVFGGGNMGTVAGNTNVYYNVGLLGTVVGSLYGGGYKGKIDGNTFVELAGGLLINAYGGSREANIGGATHVWAYDGANRPEGEDETYPEKAPLLIGNLYGGNDISGTVGTADDASGVEAQWSISKWSDLSGKNFNSYVQVGGTEGTYNGYPLVGNIFAGGNGEKTADGVPAPDIAKTLLEIDGGTTLRAFGGGNKATVTKDAYILVYAPNDVFTNYTFNPYQKKVLMETVFKGVLSGYRWEESTLIMDSYHVVKMYGGNNLATMAIQPKWGLKQGLIENVYSGGNMGDMTYYNAGGKPATTDGEMPKMVDDKMVPSPAGVEYNDDGTNANYTPRGLSITINSPLINIKNLFGGCRLSNVVPGGYNNDGTLALRSAFNECEDLYGATINILQGNIENVYGGNDVGGKVYFGTNINISGGVLGNVYGSGNGDYLYKFDSKETTVTEQLNDEFGFYYTVPEKVGDALIDPAGTEDSATHKILTINRIRPAVDNTFINIAGMEHSDGPDGTGSKRVAAVKGNIFMGGNATTITRDGNFTFGKFKLGSYTTINGLFLGSDGHSYTQNSFIEQFAKLNGIDDMGAATSFKSGHDLDKQHNPILLNAYLMAVDVQSPPKDFTIKGSSLTEAYIGTFCGGGNRGSMLHDKTVELDFPADLVIYDKIVAGCMNATVNYNQNGTNVQSIGGYVRGLDIANNNGNGNTKIRYTINSQFKPLVMDAEFDKDGNNKHGDDLATAMGKGFVYEHLNAASDGWLTGCNIYGGCYQSGEIVGDVVLNVNSNMLQVPLTNSTEEAKLKKSIANGETCFNVFGAGFGQDSHMWGNVHITMDGTKASVNNIFGGGRNGKLIGNSLIEVRNGRVYSDVVGGCYASDMYGSSQIIVGYPTYYKCNTSGEYQLQRGDKWNTTQQVIKRSVRYLKGDLVPKNVYEQIVAHTAGNAAHFDVVNDAPTNWADVDIQISEGIYGGGYSLASSTSASAGNNTTLKLKATPGDLSELETLHPLNFNDRYGLEAELNTEGYGGNSAIMVGDVAGAGSDDHISISSAVDTNNDGKNDFYYGGIYGDGHLTFCEGFRAADLTGYGYNTASPSAPRLLNTFQRLDLLDVNDCCLELQGAQDFAANQIDATTYSLTRIDELRMNSTLSADAAVTPLSNPNGSAADGFSSSKVRNYIGFNNLVHYLGALVTNDKFDNSQHTFRKADGTMGTRSYQAEKEAYISTYSSSAKDADATNAFKKRNQGTARNCIGLNSGYCLRVQNLGTNDKLYYGPIVGVCEVKLLSLQQGEGGGYVYADNVHKGHNGSSNGTGFLNVSGNFVFPGVVGQGDDGEGHPIADQYIVDDCFATRYGSPENITSPVHGTADEAHYWYVEGNKYFYNTTLTGYTYQEALTFNLKDNDPNVVLSGLENGSTLKVKKIEWLSAASGYHRGGYKPVLYNQSSPDETDDYEFDIDVNGTSWTANMPRWNDSSEKEPAPYNSTETPILNVTLKDKQDNSGDEAYNNHLDEPEKVIIYLEGETSGQTYEYTITLNIVYLQGPTYTGGVDILNCALPGERIGFSTDGITIKTPDLMPITATSWKKLPLQSKAAGNYQWDTATGEPIQSKMYSEDLNGSVTGSIPALYNENEYNIAFIFTAGGHDFLVLPSSTLPKKEQRMIVVHNYHRMKDVVAQGIEESVTAGACVYLQDEDDLTKFVEWVNAGKLTEGVNFILQDSIRLTKPLTALSQSFAGTFHGDGYHINLGTHAGSLFDSYLTGKVYNLGLVGGTIATSGTRTNCYDSNTDANEIRYGKTAYDLSHYFTPTKEGGSTVDDANNYVKTRYANGDYQYATTGSVWSLRTGEAWYGHTETRHDTRHTHDANRWVDDNDDDNDNDDVLCHTGHNKPLYDGEKVIANIPITDDRTDEVIGYVQGIPAGYANDYLFFGQHLDLNEADDYPVHIDPIAKGDLALEVTESAAQARGGNRVYETAGYYQSITDQKFHYNKDAWALKPSLTAINFTSMTNEGDGSATLPVIFSVDSNKDYTGASYSNATTGHVTQNLLVYNDGEDVFAYLDTRDSDEAEVRYHNIRERHDPDPSGVHNGNDPLDYSQHRVPDASLHTALPDRVNPEPYVTDYFHLVDKQEFCAPIAFDVDVLAWYERLPQSYRNVWGSDASNYNVPSAWEGICLPFTVMTVNGEAPGNIISHFYGDDIDMDGVYNGSDSHSYSPPRKADASINTSLVEWSKTNDHTLHHEYWLTGLVAADGEKATFARPGLSDGGDLYYHASQHHDDYLFENTYYRTLPDYLSHYGTRDDDVYGAGNDQPWYSVPHTFKGYIHQTHDLPYLIAFPGDGYYEFDLSESGPIDHNQVITFSAPVTTIPVSAPVTTDVGTHHHVGTYLHVAADGGRYVTNVAGTAFVPGQAVLPFRTYMTTSSSSARRIRINAYEQKDESADIDTAEPSMHIYGDGTTLVVESNFETDLRIFSTAGRCMRNVHVVNGTNRYPDFHPDVYIVGGVKVLLVP